MLKRYINFNYNFRFCNVFGLADLVWFLMKMAEHFYKLNSENVVLSSFGSWTCSRGGWKMEGRHIHLTFSDFCRILTVSGLWWVFGTICTSFFVHMLHKFAHIWVGIEFRLKPCRRPLAEALVLISQSGLFTNGYTALIPACQLYISFCLALGLRIRSKPLTV